MSPLVIATLGATLIHVALSVLYPVPFLMLFTAPGVALAGYIAWSDLHKGRGRIWAFRFAAFHFYLVLIALGVTHPYWLLGPMLLVLAVWNAYKWKDTERG